MTMTTNTNNSATSENCELTDDELNAASGGIIVVCGSTSGGGGAGKVTFNPFSIVRETDASSPSLF